MVLHPFLKNWTQKNHLHNDEEHITKKNVSLIQNQKSF